LELEVIAVTTDTFILQLEVVDLELVILQLDLHHSDELPKQSLLLQCIVLDSNPNHLLLQRRADQLQLGGALRLHHVVFAKRVKDECEVPGEADRVRLGYISHPVND